MIVLSSPSPRKLSLYSSIGCGILAALGIVFTGVVAFTQLPEAWQNPDRSELCWVILQIFVGLVSIFGAVGQLTQQLTIGDPRQRLVATEETLAIKTVREPILFVKRRDCIALAFDGKTLLTADGKAHPIHAFGANARTVDAFIDSLYDLWWPGLARAEVRKYLTVNAPLTSRWRMLPLFTCIVLLVFMPIFSMWKNTWTPEMLYCIVLLCFILLFIFGVRYLLIRTLSHPPHLDENTVRFFLVESDEETRPRNSTEPHEPNE